MEKKENKKIGLYVALGTVAFLALCTTAVVIAKKCERCKNY